jgi:uncharacterized protein
VSIVKLKVPFAEIPANGSRYSISDDAWLAEAGLRRAADVQAELELHCKGEQRVEVRGSLHTGLRLTCDRCLNDYDFPVDTSFCLVLEASEEADWSVKELDGAAELDVVQVDEPAADLEDILRQQALLSLPVKQLCSPDCRGLCPGCGADLNSGGCACPSAAEKSPFAVLAALKKK